MRIWPCPAATFPDLALTRQREILAAANCAGYHRLSALRKVYAYTGNFRRARGRTGPVRERLNCSGDYQRRGTGSYVAVPDFLPVRKKVGIFPFPFALILPRRSKAYLSLR